MEKEHNNLITNELAIKIIDSRKPMGVFYTKVANGTYMGIDNSTGDAWTEDFESLEDCLKWLEGDGVRKRKLNANRMLEDLKAVIDDWSKKYSADRREILHTAQAALSFMQINEED